MRAPYICLRRDLGEDSSWSRDVRLVPGRNCDRKDKRAVIGYHEAMIMGDIDRRWCDRGSPVEDVINRADRSSVDPKESGFRREIKSVIGIAHVKRRGPVL